MAKNLAKPKMNGSEEMEGAEKIGGEEIETAAELAESAAATLFYDQEHLSQIMPAVERSRDPSRVVGTALGQILLVAYNKLNQADLGVDERVWASENGVIDNMLDEVLEFFGQAGFQLNPEATAQSVLDVLKDSPVAQPEGQTAPAQGGAPNNMAVPQGAMA